MQHMEVVQGRSDSWGVFTSKQNFTFHWLFKPVVLNWEEAWSGCIN